MKDTFYDNDPVPYSVTTEFVRHDGERFIRQTLRVKGFSAALVVLFRGVWLVLEGRA